MLHDEPMVIRERGSTTRQAFELAASAAGVRPKIALEIESREAVREAVAAGLGFGVVSAPEIGSDERLATIQIEGADVFTEEHLVCLEERRRARAIRVFFEIAREVTPRSARVTRGRSVSEPDDP